MLQTIKYITYLCLFCLLFSCKNDPSPTTEKIIQPTPPKDPLFQLLPASQTKIDFVNTLKEGLNTNVLMYEYFYNGGGIAAGDFNGDGLIDLYFTSNMGENKLYLNKGDSDGQGLQFEDITAISKAGGRPGPWKTGVTHVDVNGDGKLDLYVCYSGSLPEPKRQNQLFINQGNNAENIPVFVDKAAEYGLNSPAFSNQGYFFDYDKDGDLDMLLLNHNPKSLPVLNESQDSVLAQGMKRAFEYMGLTPGQSVQDIPVDRVFIGSCTNSRIEDLRIAAQIAQGQKVSSRVKQALVVPGSGLVKAQAEQEGLDKVFIEAGFEWREPGCSMCLAMNADRLAPQEHCASTSNRNFEGRQGYGGRTHLVSPAMAAAAAIHGQFVNVAELS